MRLSQRTRPGRRLRIGEDLLEVDEDAVDQEVAEAVEEDEDEVVVEDFRTVVVCQRAKKGHLVAIFPTRQRTLAETLG